MNLLQKINHDLTFEKATRILALVSVTALLLWMIGGTLSLFGAIAVCVAIAFTTVVLGILLAMNSQNS